MCGRFTQPGTTAELMELLPGLRILEEPRERFNVAPTQMVPAVLNDGRLELSPVRWGLVPSWSKDPSVGARMINARAEGIEAKPSFRTPLRKRRCLVLANGFYEWGQIEGRGKTPIYFRLRTGKPFAFAGLWDTWRDTKSGEALTTCTLITCAANELVGRFHHRMPVILPRERMMDWIAPEEFDAARATAFLRAYPPEEMQCHAVSTRVNNARNEGADLVEPEQTELF